MVLPVLALYVISSLCVMTSAEPKLSFEQTTDVTFNCTLAGFDKEMAQLLSLQIVAGHFGDVAAIVDEKGVRTPRSPRFDHTIPFRHATGKLHSQRKRDSWLQFTIFNFDMERRDRHFDFSCQIIYLEHPDDSQPSSWTEHLRSVSYGKAVPVFSERDGSSVLAVCEHEGLISYSAVNYYRGVVASWFAYGRAPAPGSIFPSRYNIIPVLEKPSGATGESRIPEIDCEAFSCRCQCSVQSLSGRMLTSPSQRISSVNCPEVITCFLGPETAPVNHVPVQIIVFVVVAVIIVVILVLVCRQKAKRASFKSTPVKENSENEARECLSGHPTAKTEAQDVDMRKSPEEHSLSGSDGESIASSFLNLALHVRPETSSL